MIGLASCGGGDLQFLIPIFDPTTRVVRPRMAYHSRQRAIIGVGPENVVELDVIVLCSGKPNGNRGLPVRIDNGYAAEATGKMPTLFQGICRQCGHTTPLLSKGYGAIFVDQPIVQTQHEVAGAVITSGEGGALASIDDQRFVVLRHPIEDSDLRKTGYTWRDLLRQGRYVRITNVICRECGTLFHRRRLAAPGAYGSITELVLGVIVGLTVGVLMRGFVAGFLAFYFVTTAVSLGAGFYATLYVRLRFGARAKALASERTCPSCGTDHAKTIGWGRSVVCPVCRRRSLRFKTAGIS